LSICQKQGRNESPFCPLNRDNKPELKRNHHDNTSTQILIWTDDDLIKLSCVKIVQNLENYSIPK
jgi:hypothetical protein